MEVLLNRRVVRGVTRYMVRWRGHTSADDEWLRLEELAHCGVRHRSPSPQRRPPPRRSTSQSTAPPRGPARPARPSATGLGPTALPRLLQPLCRQRRQRLLPLQVSSGLAAPSEVLTGSALVGRPVLFYWPTDGCRFGRGAEALCRASLLKYLQARCRSRTRALWRLGNLTGASARASRASGGFGRLAPRAPRRLCQPWTAGCESCRGALASRPVRRPGVGAGRCSG